MILPFASSPTMSYRNTSWVMMVSPSMPITSVMWVMRREPSRRRAACTMTSIEAQIISRMVREGSEKPPIVIIDSQRDRASRGLLACSVPIDPSGREAFDLLQAMNTGHDGTMGTLHANNPREALSRRESMITMGGFSLPSRTIREMICASIDVIIQAARLRDGSRRITHITEVMGMEGDTIITQELFVFDLIGEDANGQIVGRHRSTGIGRPRFWDRARYYGEEKRLAAAIDASEVVGEVQRGAP